MFGLNSDQFNFARVYDEALLERLQASQPSEYSQVDIESVKALEDVSETLLEIKTRGLQSLARCMGDTTETDAPADGVDVMTVWFMVRDGFEDIRDLQELLNKLKHYIHKYELFMAIQGKGGDQ